MAYVICPPCIGEKNGACVEVCPVNAIHPRPNDTNFPFEEQLYIDPAACTDCTLCAEACPVGAIYPEQGVPYEWHDAIQKNADYFGG